MDQTPALDPFVLIDYPGQQATQAIRKKIRSRAATYSHAVGRQSYKSAARGQQSKIRGGISCTSPSEKCCQDQQMLDRSSDEKPGGAKTPLRAPDQRSLNLSSKVKPSDAETRLAPIRPPVDDGISFPVPEQAFYRSTITFMWRWMHDAWKMLDVSATERASALIWVQQLTLTCPAYFYMNMLSCCSTLVEKGVHNRCLLPWLTTQTVRAINAALDDSQHMLDVGVILAVGRIALEECMRGNPEVGLRIHRPAQARMLAMAGGLESLAIPALVRQHIMWAERLVYRRTGISLNELHPGAMSQNAMQMDAGRDEKILEAYYLLN